MAAQQAAVNAQNEGGGHHGGGRQPGAKIWSGREGKLLVEQMKELCFPDESLSEKDERWKLLGKTVAEEMGFTAPRNPSGNRDHAKALYVIVRSISMMYSTEKKTPECPEELDEENQESVETFRQYCHAVYQFMLTLSDSVKKEKEINLKWWDEDLFIMVRMAIFNQGKKSKTVAKEQKHKFEADQDAKAKMAEENKKKRELEDLEMRENNKKMALAVVQQGETGKSLVESLGHMVNVLKDFSSPDGAAAAAAPANDARLGNLESGLAEVKADVSAVNGKLDQILAALSK